MVDLFSERVPKDRRARFLKDQRALVDKTMKHLSPHSERVEYLDNRNLTGNPYEGLFQVWIHADKVRSAESNEDLGVFVIYQVKPVKEVPPSVQKEA
jgi:hypothetical protein